MPGTGTATSTSIVLPPAGEAHNPHSGVFDEESGEWIHYKSSTDALIAKLHLETRIPARYIDTFLDLLRNDQFDATQVSFTKSADIDKSVADYRHAQAHQRAFFREFPTTRLPYDVFPLIVDAIVGERLPLRTDDRESCFGKLSSGHRFPDGIASRLKALALTHRSLTPLAQRALGQRIFVQKAEHLRALTRSPLLGPWTTELIVNLYYFSSSESSTPEAVIDCLVAVLRRSPGLRFLRIRTPASLEQASVVYLRQLLLVIAQLVQLETLWWISPGGSSRFARVDVEYVCRVVNVMPRLRTLVIRNAQCGWKGFDEEDAARPHHLESLSLTDLLCPGGQIESGCLHWLLESNSPNPTLTSLSLGLNTSPHTLEPILSASPALARLQTLRLRLVQPPAPGFLSRLFPPSRSASALHTLQLSCENPAAWRHTLFSADALAGVPHGVCSLQLSFFHLGETLEQWSAQEDEVVRFVGSTDRRRLGLKELEIVMPMRQRPWPWTHLEAICQTCGCALYVRREIC